MKKFYYVVSFQGQSWRPDAVTVNSAANIAEDEK